MKMFLLVYSCLNYCDKNSNDEDVSLKKTSNRKTGNTNVVLVLLVVVITMETM